MSANVQVVVQFRWKKEWKERPTQQRLQQQLTITILPLNLYLPRLRPEENLVDRSRSQAGRNWMVWFRIINPTWPPSSATLKRCLNMLLISLVANWPSPWKLAVKYSRNCSLRNTLWVSFWSDKIFNLFQILWSKCYISK